MNDAGNVLRELIAAATLEDVRFFRLCAEEFEEPEADDEVEVPSFDFRVRQFRKGSGAGRPGDDSIGLDFHLRVTAPIPDGTGEVVAAPVATYVFPAEARSLLTSEGIKSFANDVAVMVLVPYAREAVASLALKGFRGAFLMPVIRRGELEFDVDFTLDADEGVAE